MLLGKSAEEETNPLVHFTTTHCELLPFDILRLKKA